MKKNYPAYIQNYFNFWAIKDNCAYRVKWIEHTGSGIPDKTRVTYCESGEKAKEFMAEFLGTKNAYKQYICWEEVTRKQCKKQEQMYQQLHDLARLMRKMKKEYEEETGNEITYREFGLI